MTSPVQNPSPASVRRAFLAQRDYCTAMDAPITARICAGLARSLSTASRTGARALDWRGDPLDDALPLRLVGGLHALALRAPGTAADGLAALFDGAITEDARPSSENRSRQGSRGSSSIRSSGNIWAMQGEPGLPPRSRQPGEPQPTSARSAG